MNHWLTWEIIYICKVSLDCTVQTLYSDGITYLEQFLLNISNISIPATNLSLGHRPLRVFLSSNVICANKKNLIRCWGIVTLKISGSMPDLNKSSMLWWFMLYNPLKKTSPMNAFNSSFVACFNQVYFWTVEGVFLESPKFV